jgi:hypothetical protein
VETADVNERQGYANLFRDQLSKFELTLFFYHYLSKPGRKQKYLVEKYQMLTNLDFHWLIQYGHKDAYQPAAFGVRDDA